MGAGVKELLMELTGLEMTAVHRAVMLEVAVWAVMLAAVYIDYRTGIRRARVLGIPRDSHGIRRSFSKFGDYCKVAGMLMLIDLLAILFGIYSLPYGSALAGLATVYTELRSVRENLAAIKSSAVKMTDILALLAEARDPKEIVGLLKRYNALCNGADKRQAKAVKALENLIEKTGQNDTERV